MFIIKTIILLVIFCTSSLIGITISKKYSNRVNNLKEFKSALSMFETKIKYTYEPIPEIFKEISKNTKENISQIFIQASNKMNNQSAGEAWKDAIEASSIEINKEDKNILKEMSKLLSEIKLTSKFLDKQIELAQQEKQKNEKLYRTLGMTIGLAIVILLI